MSLAMRSPALAVLVALLREGAVRAVRPVLPYLSRLAGALLVASDGHRATRPPYLDEAHARARARLGQRADRFFDGTALGLAGAAERRRRERAAPAPIR